MISYAFCAPQKSITKPPTPKAASASPSESTPFFPTTEAEPSEVCANTLGNGRIEAKVRLNQDRWQFFALYLVRRTRFCGSSIQKILFCYSKDIFCCSFYTELVSWLLVRRSTFSVSVHSLWVEHYSCALGYELYTMSQLIHSCPRPDGPPCSSSPLLLFQD